MASSPENGIANNGAGGSEEPAFVRRLADELSPAEEQCFRAIQARNPQSLEELLQAHGATLEFSKRNAHGYTFLQAAVFAGQVEMADILLATGKANPIEEGMNAALSLGNTAMVNLFMKYVSGKASKRRASPKTSSSIKRPDSKMDNVAKTVIPEEEEEDDTDDDLVRDGAILSGNIHINLDLTEKERKIGGAANSFERSLSCPLNMTNSPTINEKPETIELNLKGHLPIVGQESILRRAASAENFKVTEALIIAGVKLSEPEHLHSDSGDSLQDATECLRTYRALASATYLALTAEDPIKVAFERSKHLQELSIKHPQHKAEFQQLAKRASSFAVELMSLCRSSMEVHTLLLLRDPSASPFSATKFGRLQLAVRFKQKEFIAHPNCQEVMYSLWSDGTHGWKKWTYPRRILHIAIQSLLLVIMPFLATFAPNCRLAAPTLVPLNRFIYSASTYTVFLALMLTFLLLDWKISLWGVFIFVLGNCVRLFAMDIPIQGLRPFFNRFWNLYDVCMYGIFLSALLCFLLTKVSSLGISVCVVGEGLFAVAAILAICRILQWFHLHQSLGPLIIAFSKIVGVVLKLSMICFVLFAAFAINIFYVYRNTATSKDEDAQFSSFDSTLSAHFWALYGHGELKDGQRQWTDAFRNISGASSPEDNVNTTVFIGTLLWGLFHVVSVIILLNMLIAMMTETFQRVQMNCDYEWKFARTVLWLYYFDDCNTVPPPFNILTVIKGYTVWLFEIVSCSKKNPKDLERQKSTLNWSLMRKAVSSGAGGQMHTTLRKMSETNPEKMKNEYSNLIKVLIQRYLQKKDLEKKGSNGS